MVIIRCILLLLLLQWFTPLHADEHTVVEHNISTLQHYIITSDTNGLNDVLLNMNSNFHLYRDGRYLVLFNNGARKAEKDNPMLAQALYTFAGLWHKQQHNIDPAVDNLVKAYELIEKKGKKRDGLWLLIELGNLFFSEGESEQASVFYNKALAIATEVRDHYALSVIWLNLGLVEHIKGNISLEIEMFKRSSKERLLSMNPCFVSHTYIKLADAYLELNNADSAYKYLTEAREIYESEGHKHGLLYEMPALIGLTSFKYHVMQGEEAEARLSLENARAYLEDNDLRYMLLHSYLVESKHLFETGRYKELDAVLSGKISEFRKEGLVDLERQGLSYLVKAWSSLGNESLALQGYEQLLKIDDSTRNEGHRTKLNQVRSIIELFEKDADLRVAQQQLLHGQEKERMRARERDITLIFTLVGFVLSITLFLLMKRIQRQKRNLLRLHVEMAGQNEQVKENALKLERSNLIKDKLFSIIGHDLRGPMNSLLGMVGLMRTELKENPKPDLSPHLQLMENTLRETIDLFERLLQWSKLDKKQMQFNPVAIDIEEMVAHVLRFYEPALRYKKIDVKFTSCGKEGYADPNITHTVLRNLVANAIQALPAGKTIFISTEVKNADEMMVRVRDNGYGFLASVLERFSNEEGADAASLNGLGLVLCRELARLNKGSLTIANHPEGGADVCFTLQMMSGTVAENAE